MITIGYSTRKSNPEFKKHLIKNCGLDPKKIQIIEIVNNGEKSLTECYNEILSLSNNKYIVFCHDDIEVSTKQWGNKLIKLFEKNPDFGIIGVAGTTDLLNGCWWELKKSMVGIVSHLHNGKKHTNKYSNNLGKNLKDVVIVDGLFFIINKEKIKNNFNEEFKGFHFYDLSFCIENYINNVKIGVTTILDITHMSIGITNDEWLINKKLFEEKYQNNLPIRLSNNKTFEEKLNFDITSIGVGMVTYNAEHRIKQSAFTIPKWIKNFVIVNDGTPYSESSYPENATIIQHEKNMCVGIAKNTAIKYLMEKNCEHIFLIEDDILIKDENVFKEYIKHSLISGIKHLNFALHGPANKKGSTGFTDLSQRKDLNTEPNPRMIINYPEEISIALYPNCVGAFSYYNREVIEKIGYFDTFFKNAWEHVEHTYQTIKNNFHPPFWYFADIANSYLYLTDIPNAIEESTIGRTKEWKQNFERSTNYYKKKHGLTPTEKPLVDQNYVNNILQQLYILR